jgi:hypothetical protein
MSNVIISLQSDYSQLYFREIEEVSEEAFDKAMWELCVLVVVNYADEVRKTKNLQSLVDLVGSWGIWVDIEGLN